MRGKSIHIGVDGVDASAYPKPPAPLQAASLDAEAMCALAQQQKLDAVLLSGPQATRSAVEAAISNAAAELQPGDLCVITFAGHGGRIPDLVDPATQTWPVGAQDRRVADPDDGDDEYWCLWDGVLLDDRIYELLTTFRAGVCIYVLSDSCYSGTMLRRRNAAAALPASDDVADALPVVAASVVLLAACLEDRRTYETVTHGLFTQAVLEVWNQGEFHGSQRAFHGAIQARFQTATVFRVGQYNRAFEDARPFTITPPPAGFVPPIKVHLCWFAGSSANPACTEIAREIYELLHRPVGDDPVLRPGLEIPVEYGRDLASLLSAVNRPAYDASREPAVGARVIVVILDRAAYSSQPFRETLRQAVQRWPAPSKAGQSEVLLPIVLHPSWTSELGGLPEQTLPAVIVDERDPDRRWRVPSEVAVVAGRALMRAFRDGSPRRPQVFISHTKSDGHGLAEQLATQFKMKLKAPIDAWYDETDVDRGDELVSQLERAAGDGVVLVIRTDRYSESPWCGLELLTAKRRRVPLVTLLDGHDGEPTTSTYGGNHRTMVWRRGRDWEVASRCVQAWLHGHHFTAHAGAALAHAGLPADAEIVARRPELIDLAQPSASSGRRIIVYPDPPLAESEVAVLRAAQPSLRLVTPNTMLGRVLLAADPSPPLAGRTLAFSLSTAEDLPELGTEVTDHGLTQQHLNDVLYTVVLTTLQTGARIAYGGDFRTDQGYARHLSDLHRARRRLGTGTRSQLECYLEETGLRAGDGDVEYAPVEVAAPPGAARCSPAVRETLWQMAMRDMMTRRCDGRVVLGGQTRPATTDDGSGYVGPWPGILEEAWRTLEAGKALYLIGAFGGFAAMLVRMLIDDQLPTELVTATHTGTRLAMHAAEVDDARRALVPAGQNDTALMVDGGVALGIEQLAQRVLDRWRAFCGGNRAAWKNGLSVDENLRLFRSSDPTEIAHLVFEGLRQVTRRSTDTLELVLYHGDIASAVDVDGYAVTTTPGLRHVGALAALDQRMSGRLGRKIANAKPSASVSWHEVETDSLAGRMVFVARLELPRSGSFLSEATLEGVASEIVRQADQFGIESIAAAPFGASMGVPPATAVQAMIRGMRAGRGKLPRTLVVCEADRERYEAVRAALSTDAAIRELRAGPSPSTVADTVVLHVNAFPEDPDQSVRVHTTAFAPDFGHAVVPHRTVHLTADRWSQLRTRPVRFDATLALGQLLREDLLSIETLALLQRHADRRLLLIANDLASGLPWEMLGATAGDPPAVAADLVRRIALSGDARAPADRASTDARLRVLLIVDPLGDLPGAAAEGDAVIAALRDRPDVELIEVRGGAADCARLHQELEVGYYDILHYAGHASFDRQQPERSGLHLADGTFTAAKLGEIQVPRLVVLSGCESARIRAQPPAATATAAAGDDGACTPSDAQPLADALLRAGVTSLIGTFFPVSDAAACMFATELHGTLAAGKTVGDAVHDARRKLFARHDADWGNFILYGDDRLIL
jgi:CHAT domain/SLOG cluster2/Caspase domain/TIR domain